MENGFRSMAQFCEKTEEKKKDGTLLHALLYHMLPLTVFWRRNIVRAADELSENYERVDCLLDVLAQLWCVLYSITGFPDSLRDQIKAFSLVCTEDLNVYADW